MWYFPHLAPQLFQSKFPNSFSSRARCFYLKKKQRSSWSSTMHRPQSMINLLRESLRLCIDETQFKDCLTIPSITVSIGPSIFPKDDPRDLKVMVLSEAAHFSPHFFSPLDHVKALLGFPPGGRQAFHFNSQVRERSWSLVRVLLAAVQNQKYHWQNQLRWMGGGTYWLL